MARGNRREGRHDDELKLDIVSRTDLATTFGYSPRTLEDWASNGTGPVPFRLGAEVYYLKDDVRGWVRAEAAKAKATHDRRGRECNAI